ncbi:MAG: GntR family transcriptional regulator [Planctomycetes bacterium]|nr:GntR family transcriptional regulator [Planctomycetota bacterium]
MDRRKPRARPRSQAGLVRGIFDGLCQEITSGKLRPGEVLSRRQIAERYGASYTPVIEALVRLENIGLIEASSHQQARVRPLNAETIQNDCILREAYETQAIRLACEHATDREIDELARLAEELDQRIKAHHSAKSAADPHGPTLHFQFHMRIAQLSRCPALVRAFENMELSRRIQTLWEFGAVMDDPPRFHSLLVDAIRTGNAIKADAAMRSHVQHGLERELRGYRLWAAQVESDTP